MRLCGGDSATSDDGVLHCKSQNEDDAFRKMRLRVEDVQGRNCLTNFWVGGVWDELLGPGLASLYYAGPGSSLCGCTCKYPCVMLRKCT